MSLRVAPMTIAAARSLCREIHRRLPDVQGGMWAIGLWDGERWLGCAIVSRPAARMSDAGADEPKMELEVKRVAVRERVANGCSMLYGCAARAAKAMGCERLTTTIHIDEPGTSLRASGWIDEGLCGGGDWSESGRASRKPLDERPKRRWRTSWSCLAGEVSSSPGRKRERRATDEDGQMSMAWEDCG